MKNELAKFTTNSCSHSWQEIQHAHKKAAHNAVQLAGPPLEIMLQHALALDTTGGTLEHHSMLGQIEKGAGQRSGKVIINIAIARWVRRGLRLLRRRHSY